MRQVLIISTFGIIAFFSCNQKGNRNFTNEENQYFKSYTLFDTLTFLSSKKERDTFCIIRIDSSLRTDLGYFGNKVQHDKYIFIRHLPIDTSNGMNEEHLNKYKLDHHAFLSIHKYPNENRRSYCFRFKGFESCTENSFGYFLGTVTIMNRKISDCYTFKKSTENANTSNNGITDIYWKIDLGLVAYKQFDGTEWILESFR